MFLGACSNHFLETFLPVLYVQIFKKIGTWKCNSPSTYDLFSRKYQEQHEAAPVKEPKKYMTKFKTQNKSCFPQKINCLALPETGNLYSPGNPRKLQIGPPGTKNPFQKNMIQGIPPNNNIIDPFMFRHFLGKN